MKCPGLVLKPDSTSTCADALTATSIAAIQATVCLTLASPTGAERRSPRVPVRHRAGFTTATTKAFGRNVSPRCDRSCPQRSDDCKMPLALAIAREPCRAFRLAASGESETTALVSFQPQNGLSRCRPRPADAERPRKRPFAHCGSRGLRCSHGPYSVSPNVTEMKTPICSRDTAATGQ